jgi:hypothetical protein
MVNEQKEEGECSNKPVSVADLTAFGGGEERGEKGRGGDRVRG